MLDELEENAIRDFQHAICEDMEFTGDCIHQTRLSDVIFDFNRSTIQEYVCLRKHSCCRIRMAKRMLEIIPGITKREAITEIVKFFIAPIQKEHVNYYVELSFTEFPNWFRENQCISSALMELYDEHMASGQRVVEDSELEAMKLHTRACPSCREELKTLPNVALRSI